MNTPTVNLASAKPSDFDTLNNRHFYDVFDHCEAEMVARNLIVILAKDGDAWKPITYDYYCQNCNHKPNHYDADGFDMLVKQDALAFHDYTYHFTDFFVKKLVEFIKK